MTNLKIVNNADPGDADRTGGDDWDAMVALLNAVDAKEYDYVLNRQGSTYTAKSDGWNVDSTSSTAETVIQYAIDHCHTGGIIGVKGGNGSSGFFNLTGPISLVNKAVQIRGFNTTNSGQQARFVKNYATAEPFINMENTVFCTNSLRNIQISGNSTSGDIGVKINFGRNNILENVNILGFDVGLWGADWVNCDIYNLRISTCLTRGIYFPFITERINTVRFHGGAITGNPTNLYMDGSALNDVVFFATEFEGGNSGYVHGVDNHSSGANDILYLKCSFEKNVESGKEVIYEGGNNITYQKCRFDSDVDQTPIHLLSTAKNIKIIDCFFQTNTVGTTQQVIVDSGAINCQFLNNSKSTNSVATVTLTDNGTNTRVEGCAAMGSTWANKIPTSVLFNDFIEQKAISAPSSPATGFVRAYPKTIDANNDGLFIKRRLNGAVVEVQIG